MIKFLNLFTVLEKKCGIVCVEDLSRKFLTKQSNKIFHFFQNMKFVKMIHFLIRADVDLNADKPLLNKFRILL